jgi:hypothetical protein
MSDDTPTVTPVSTPPGLTPKRQKGMGHIAKAYPSIALTIRHLLGAIGAQPLMPVSWSDYVGPILDQLQTQRCVGFARARVYHILAQRQRFGRANPGGVPYPSGTGIYTLAREQGGMNPLVDIGSSPADADEACAGEVGVPLERDWSSTDSSKVNAPIPVEVLARAMQIKLSAYYRIDSSGSQRVTDACQTLTQHGPFTMAIPVGPEYEECASDAPVMACSLDKPYGMHDIPLTEWRYDPNGTGRRQFKSPGSWGTYFGFGGWAWLDESVLADPRAIDFTAPTVITNWVGVRRYIDKLAEQAAAKEVTS